MRKGVRIGPADLERQDGAKNRGKTPSPTPNFLNNEQKLDNALFLTIFSMYNYLNLFVR